ncbi:MAG TPA: SurA N-terminal domain-containing protein, partial [Amaricoccus sp.]|nr:SurA N-terminal domain-containing protein [Amaricoccus sp.]
MLQSFRHKRAGVAMYILLALLVIGLAGFGIGVGGAISSNKVASVGDVPVTSDDYVRAMQQELRALQQQTGRSLTMAEARQYGVDAMVLTRLVNDAALDGEARRLGLSTGDAAVRAQVVATPAFQGSDGSFSPEAYTASLERAGFRPAEFEALLRREATRDLLTRAVQSATTLPDSEAKAVLAFLGERRSFDWLRLDADLLPEPVPAPTDAELAAEHEAHAADRYTRPETRHIIYASLTPESVAAATEIPEDELRAAYEAEIDRFETPERRAIDRIGFGTEEEAAAAKARIAAGETDFDKVAAERGLAPADIDQGTVAADALPEGARAAVFGTAEPGIVGPVTTPLGPALYRVNAILAPKTTPFEEARADLAKERGLEAAQQQILDETTHIQDLIAGGATIEEIASETPMELGSLALSSETTGGIADDPAFRDAALKADTGVETDLIELAGGGLATLRVDSIDPPEVSPLAEVRDRVAADWREARTAEALQKLADGFRDELKGGLALPEIARRLDRPILSAGPLSRGESGPGAPSGLTADIFAAGG